MEFAIIEHVYTGWILNCNWLGTIKFYLYSQIIFGFDLRLGAKYPLLVHL